MDIKEKIAQLESEKSRIDQKIALLRELDDGVPAEQRKSVAQDTIKAIEKDTRILSKTKKGNVEITEEWIGGSGAGKPSDYVNK
jgi:hypothetical protein